MKAALILGTQLLRDHPALTDESVDVVIMIEAQDLCAKLPYHRHKLILLLAGMRHYQELAQSHKSVIYHEIQDTPVFKAALVETLKNNAVTELIWMTSSDTPANRRLQSIADEMNVQTMRYDNGLFITPEQLLREWFEKHPKALMETFYRWQRQRTGILCEGTLPVGGQWNFDENNRQALPKSGIAIPPLPSIKADDITKSVMQSIDALFPNNPGASNNFWLPVTHKSADEWLDNFMTYRFDQFGPYEDAMQNGEAFLFHSVLSPLINCGLLSVDQVINAALTTYGQDDARLASVEGFIRQLIGWREYMYGIYLSQPDLKEANYFGLTKELEDWWYTDAALQQDLPPPVLGALKTVYTYGYNHHIERLMVLGNWFLLNNYSPKSVYRWFSSLYVDAYEWVMVPNVMGMSQYADGGKTATKPYISGGNYLQKMGRWWPTTKSAQQSEFTQLYWEFLDRHYELLQSNFRMALVLKQVAARRNKVS
ncbi:cryptochrome/photolyase family protein [Candidatus Saccharibacteria bacterium]|nr:cryptochrome/photolyase family protein [Candidatus Saccharibacteria bacterium]